MKRALVFFVVGVVLFGAFSAQSANAQNTNIAQRIIGSWVDKGGDTWAFNANGNITITNSNGVVTFAGTFAVTDTHLAYYSVTFGYTNIREISMSSDGRTLLIYYSDTSGHGSWLTKK